ncbi:NAD(P)-dependent oxidoreductase [Pseudomonas ogarae]|uniref:NAD(P)-dependent oxidoreductase n=1 Tax=Pseudomonas ogarae (strain DSM 112162 / CECT 30235 / F113) TaxID=1114970 RepID=UPI002E260718
MCFSRRSWLRYCRCASLHWSWHCSGKPSRRECQFGLEHTFALLLAVVKRIVESDNKLHHETGFSREDLMGDEIYGGTIGLVGLGAIGTCTARIAKGFGLNVVAYDPLLREDQIRSRGAESVTLQTLLQLSDFVSLHCPLPTAYSDSTYDGS